MYVDQCPANTLRCGVLFKRCVSNAFKCDGDNDCGDLTDEANCGYETSMLCLVYIFEMFFALIFTNCLKKY